MTTRTASKLTTITDENSTLEEHEVNDDDGDGIVNLNHEKNCSFNNEEDDDQCNRVNANNSDSREKDNCHQASLSSRASLSSTAAPNGTTAKIVENDDYTDGEIDERDSHISHSNTTNKLQKPNEDKAEAATINSEWQGDDSLLTMEESEKNDFTEISPRPVSTSSSPMNTTSTSTANEAASSLSSKNDISGSHVELMDSDDSSIKDEHRDSLSELSVSDGRCKNKVKFRISFHGEEEKDTEKRKGVVPLSRELSESSANSFSARIETPPSTDGTILGGKHHHRNGPPENGGNSTRQIRSATAAYEYTSSVIRAQGGPKEKEQISYRQKGKSARRNMTRRPKANLTSLRVSNHCGNGNSPATGTSSVARMPEHISDSISSPDIATPIKEKTSYVPGKGGLKRDEDYKDNTDDKNNSNPSENIDEHTLISHHVDKRVTRISNLSEIDSSHLYPRSSVNLHLPGAISVAGISNCALDSEFSDEFLTAEHLTQVETPHATVLDSDELERNIIDQITIRSMHVEAVEVDDERKQKEKRLYILLAMVLLLMLFTVVVSLAVVLSKDDTVIVVGESTLVPSMIPSASPSISPTATPVPTIETIKARGRLICGTADEKNALEGFNQDLCRAIASALFGHSDDQREFLAFEHYGKGKVQASLNALAEETIDLLARGITYTMERDVYLNASGVGFTFSTPYLYDGLTFGGDPAFVDCANSLNYYFGRCRNLKICVCPDCTHKQILQDQWFPKNRLVLKADIYEGLASGDCNVIAQERPALSKMAVDKNLGFYNKSYEVASRLFSKEPLAIVTRDGDVPWSNFCNWILQALLVAEKYNITQESANDFRQTAAYGKEYQNMFVDAIKAVGNYGEIYKKNLNDSVPRKGLDWINTKGDTGLIYSYALGGMKHPGFDRSNYGTLGTIIKRKKLICGIRQERGFGEYNHSTAGQGEWGGMDADFCRALAASVFNKIDGAVEFVQVNGAKNSTVDDGFMALANGTLDVLSGASLTFEASVGVNGEKFSFSQPYFYSNVNEKSPLALATRQDDQYWSSFVYWVVSGTFYAEENAQIFTPEGNVFGSEFSKMFEFSMGAVGTYGDIYARNMEKYYTRNASRNMLNAIQLNGPQHFPYLSKSEVLRI